LLWACIDILTWLAAAALIAAGALKVAVPVTATKFLARLRFPAPALAVRAVALLELGAGAAVLLGAMSPALLLVIGLYVVFVVALGFHMISTGERTVTCGCFGSSAAIPIVPHLVALAFALAGTAATAAGSRASLLSVLGSLAIAKAVLLVVLLGVGLLALVGAAAATAVEERSTPAPEFTTSAQKAPEFRVVFIAGKDNRGEER